MSGSRCDAGYSLMEFVQGVGTYSFGFVLIYGVVLYPFYFSVIGGE